MSYAVPGTGKPRGYHALHRLPAEARDLVEAALDAGWLIEPSGSRQLLLQRPDGQRVRLKAEPDKPALAMLKRMVGKVVA